MTAPAAAPAATHYTTDGAAPLCPRGRAAARDLTVDARAVTCPACLGRMSVTVSCDQPAPHVSCAGYVAPLVYGSTRPCVCDCHNDDNPRDYRAAETKARESYHGKRGR